MSSFSPRTSIKISNYYCNHLPFEAQYPCSSSFIEFISSLLFEALVEVFVSSIIIFSKLLKFKLRKLLYFQSFFIIILCSAVFQVFFYSQRKERTPQIIIGLINTSTFMSSSITLSYLVGKFIAVRCNKQSEFLEWICLFPIVFNNTNDNPWRISLAQECSFSHLKITP